VAEGKNLQLNNTAILDNGERLLADNHVGEVSGQVGLRKLQLTLSFLK
jgi:hypothetical protein